MDLNLKIKSRVFLPIFRPYIFDYSNRYEIYWGGRSSGKTVFIVQKLLLKGFKEKRFIILMNKQTNGIKDKVWKELRDAISFFKLNDYFELNKSDFRATCKLNGTEIRCMGLDEPEKAKALSNVSDVYLDELNQFTQDDFELLDGTVRSTRFTLPLQIYGSFNPVSKQNWVYKYFGFDTGITPPNTFIHHSTYKDNKYTDPSYILRMETMKVRNPTRYKIEAEGQFATLDKLVYSNWRVEDFNPDEIKGELICGLDFGYTNDPTAFIASLLVEDEKKIYVFKEWGGTGMTNQEIARGIISLGFSKSFIIADSAEQKSIEELRREGLYRVRASQKGPDSIMFGIDKLKEYEIIVSPNCQETITEFENYAWQKDKQTNLYINKPIDMFNHYLDALRYSLQASQKGLRTMSKSVLSL